jgi:mRNA-degrading endonuclease toxin of MazEF toxin-antitoxin module
LDFSWKPLNAIHYFDAPLGLRALVLAMSASIYPSQALIRNGDGNLADSVVLGEQVRAISASRLVRQIGHLSPHAIAEISAILNIVLDL